MIFSGLPYLAISKAILVNIEIAHPAFSAEKSASAMTKISFTGYYTYARILLTRCRNLINKAASFRGGLICYE